LDFLTKKAEVVRLYDISEKENLGDKPVIEIDTEKGKKLLQMEIPEIKPVNSIEMELATFTESIINDTVPKVTLEDGYRALALAYEISAQITAREETFL
jgi:hypothetical protein